jgi:leader peptidase (prepilin peptidase)/N-methyltransferase
MDAGASHVLAVACSGVAGLAVGSFLNVVVYRVPRHLSVVRPPSHCPGCGTHLGALDMVPVVSWIALRGRCRHCRAPIPVRYPLVELATGGVFAAIAAAIVWL